MKKIHPLHCKSPDMHAPPTVRMGGMTNRVGMFGWTRMDEDGHPKFHRGVDWLVACGCPVWAAHDGKILQCGEESGGGGYGQRIYLDGDEVVTIYAHLSGQLLQLRDYARAGQLLGWTGRSGNFSDDTPDHLHFEVRLGGGNKEDAVNPEWWLHGLGNKMGVPVSVV